MSAAVAGTGQGFNPFVCENGAPTPVYDTPDDPSYWDRERHNQEQEKQRKSVSEAQRAAVWDFLGVLPGVGTVASAAGTVIDLGKAAYHGISGDSKSAKHDLSDAALDAIGTIPLVGSILSAEELVHDLAAGDARDKGAKPEDAPLFSDKFHDGLPSWSDITSPFTDPGSWTPQGPAQ